MSFDREIESFIRDYVKDLRESSAGIFAGAGMSKAAGFVNWPELLSEIADEIGLSVDKETDLISLAQYHVNETGGKSKINRKILEEFSAHAEPTDNHRILATLPIHTYWTTNYDTLIEDALKQANKIVDTKHEVKQLANTRPKRDVVVYKMHGDVHHPADAVLTKEQYQAYYLSHEHFITALSSDLLTKTFLFIGFSFTDPNLDYVLSRLSIHFGKDTRQHYAFIKRVTKGTDEDGDLYKYNVRKQELMINDLKRYRIKALLVDDYSVITEVLKEISVRYRKKTVFISGSAEEYGDWDKITSQGFIHQLSKALVENGFRIVNGFGWGVGSAVINGALEAIYEKPEKFSEEQLVVRPFPQFKTGNKELSELWEEYRHKMISLAGILVVVFGNKKDAEGNIVNAGGVKREFEIAIQHGLVPIPIAKTGYMTREIFEEIISQPQIYKGMEWVVPLIQDVAQHEISDKKIIDTVIKIVQNLNK